MENADYMTTHKDYSESVDALERAIAVLKKQAYDRSQAELMQVPAAPLRWQGACCRVEYPLIIEHNMSLKRKEAAGILILRSGIHLR